MRYEILCQEDFIEVRTYGDAELKVFKDLTLEILAHERWQAGGSILINHSELNAAPLDSDVLREIASFNKQFESQIGQAKIAILVARDLEFGIGRMWQAFSSDERESTTELFRSRDKAISWLKEQ